DGGVGTGTSRPNGIHRDPPKRRRRWSPTAWAENRSPTQSNQRAERAGSGTNGVTGIDTGRQGQNKRPRPQVPGSVGRGWPAREPNQALSADRGPTPFAFTPTSFLAPAAVSLQTSISKQRPVPAILN